MFFIKITGIQFVNKIVNSINSVKTTGVTKSIGRTKTTKFSKESFDHLQDIMIDYGEITEKVDYDKLFYSIS